MRNVESILVCDQNGLRPVPARLFVCQSAKVRDLTILFILFLCSADALRCKDKDTESEAGAEDDCNNQVGDELRVRHRPSTLVLGHHNLQLTKAVLFLNCAISLSLRADLITVRKRRLGLIRASRIWVVGRSLLKPSWSESWIFQFWNSISRVYELGEAVGVTMVIITMSWYCNGIESNLVHLLLVNLPAVSVCEVLKWEITWVSRCNNSNPDNYHNQAHFSINKNKFKYIYQL